MFCRVSLNIIIEDKKKKKKDFRFTRKCPCRIYMETVTYGQRRYIYLDKIKSQNQNKL